MAVPASSLRVELRAVKPVIVVRPLLGEAGASITAEGGGWETVERLRQVGFIEWRGASPRELEVSVVFDQWPNIGSVEAQCVALSRMTQPVGNNPPPWLQITGAVPVGAKTRWAITAVDWGTDVVRNDAGQRVRQDATVHLIERVVADTAFTQTAQQRLLATTTVVKAKKGDTPKKVAVRVLGAAKRWTEIRKLNQKLKRPNMAIKAGTGIRVPRK